MRIQDNPYRSQPPQAFWRNAVVDATKDYISDLWQPVDPVPSSAAFVTAGSCFARHIGPAVRAASRHWLEAEAAPPDVDPQRHGYGLFSWRTGNIYTVAGMRQWIAWASGTERPPEAVWRTGDRWLDPFRPTVEPTGFADPADVITSRERTIAAMAAALVQADVFVFTLGLTEAWEDSATGLVYPMCPGTAGGEFDPTRHRLRAMGFGEVERDLRDMLALLEKINPKLRTILTVSPVPLTATATGSHVLMANMQSKSVLRAAAGAVAGSDPRTSYFPSYELIASPLFEGRFFCPNRRDVTPEGVAFVMRHFFAGLDGPTVPPQPAASADPTSVAMDDGAFCDEVMLDYYRDA